MAAPVFLRGEFEPKLKNVFVPNIDSQIRASFFLSCIGSGVEWNKMVQTALQQIKEKRYPESILRYTGDILLVGISYDKKEKNRSARGKIT